MRMRSSVCCGVAGVALSVAALPAPPVGAAPETATSASAVTRSITVFAASSLTESFTQIGKAFEKKYKGASVTFNFGSSATLETQLDQGAPGDVFASADTANADKLATTGGHPKLFARNRLEIAVEQGNPKEITSLADTVKPGVQLVLCAPEVPCGKYADQAYQKAGVTHDQVPTGLTAKDTLSKVALGEADAAVVYATDVQAAKGDVAGVKIASKDNVIAEYAMAVVKGTSNPRTTKAFVAFVISKSGQTILARFGFLSP